ncbi:MAG: 50S ribosomal protein L16 [Nanoarchaeota archaeon]|nr:50S ribosomal protein L16 [Nanoarchaeota archaeon]
MVLRKASAYTKRKVLPFTRVSKKKGKSYVKTVPPQKIVKFCMGLQSLYMSGKLPEKIIVVADEKAQIRHNALEACRQYINKALETELMGQYFFKVCVFPHHIQRENKMLTGAGSDRMQTGMQLSYGKPVGKAAILKQGTQLFLIAVPDEKAVQFTRGVLKRVKPKIPLRLKTIHEHLTELPTNV